MKRMLDRREQLAVLHDPATPTQQLHVGRNCFGDILLLVDDGPSAELDAALAEAERQGNDELASWARKRLASQGGLDHQQERKSATSAADLGTTGILLYHAVTQRVKREVV